MKILYFAIMREWLKCDGEEFHLDGAMTIDDFIKERLEPRLNGRRIGDFLFAVNEKLVDGNQLLSDEDVLAILPPLSGGAPAFQRSALIRIQREDFDINEEIKLCVGERSDAGGIATFIGVVRNFSSGKAVESMELTHYPSMAEKQMEELRGEAIEKFGIINLTIVHRVGKLRPSDKIVGIVAVAMHRNEAFDACRFAIDELKKRVPIWKKEL